MTSDAGALLLKRTGEAIGLIERVARLVDAVDSGNSLLIKDIVSLTCL